MSERVLVWDFDGTLAIRDGYWTGTLCDVVRRERPDLTARLEDIRPHLQAGFPWHTPDVVREACTADEWWAAMLPVFSGAYRAALGVDAGEAERLARAVRAVYLEPAGWRVFDDTVPALSALRERGWRHVVLSNHVPELPQIVECLGLQAHVDALFCSADIGAEKPHRKTFEAVFARYPAARAGWMIGDSWRADVEGARAVGMRAILVRERHPEAPVQCATLHEVVRVVEAS